jgi:hypothetical protein
LHRLGRLDQLPATGGPDALVQSLGRFSEKYRVLGAHAKGQGITTRTSKIGPPLIFQRLWQQCGPDQTLGGLLGQRKFEFPVERAVFVTVLHRLVRLKSHFFARREDSARWPVSGAAQELTH